MLGRKAALSVMASEPQKMPVTTPTESIIFWFAFPMKFLHSWAVDLPEIPEWGQDAEGNPANVHLVISSRVYDPGILGDY